ncbi:MAG: nuclear transport factor 2 family protein [Pyrinomonadaceae bacterium]|nr:nuclear transport factor 2 family protein [Pyrinomonadaceae bacterium]
MTVPTRITSCITILGLCAALAVAQDTTQKQTTPQPQTNTPQTPVTPQTQTTPQVQTAPQDAKQAERARKEKEKQDKKVAKEAERKAVQSQPTGEKVAMSGTAEQAVRQLDTERVQALLRSNTTTLERIFADDYANTNNSGEVLTKGQVMAEVKSGDVKYETITIDDVQVRVYGDTAVLTGRATVKGARKGQDISGQNRVTRVYVKQAGGWRLVAQQSTRIAQQ